MEHFWKYVYSRTYTCLASQQCIWCVYHCAPLSYTTEHRTVLIMFLPNLQKVRCCLFDTRGVQGGIKKLGQWSLWVKNRCKLLLRYDTVAIRSFVRSLLRAGVQPTLDPSAETFMSVQCASPGRGGKLVGVKKQVQVYCYDTIRYGGD